MSLFTKKRLIIGMTGASGSLYTIKLLEKLREIGIETHLVVSDFGKVVLGHETELTYKQLQEKADFTYHSDDMTAKISSGSFITDGMIIAPCSVKTLAEIASGVTASLISRAADVCLKERRKCVIMLRETPLHRTHIENMLKVTDLGAIIAPAMPAFYSQIKSIDDLVEYSVIRCLDLFDIHLESAFRW